MGKIIRNKNGGGLGLRSVRQTNAAFLAKLNWRVLTEMDKLWSQILCAKYCNNQCDLEMFTHRADASNAWKGMVENIKIIQKGVRGEIGNRQNTLFWMHKWALDKPLSSEVIADLHQK